MLPLILVATLAAAAAERPVPPDTTPFTVAVRFAVTDTTPLFEQPLGDSLLLRVQREGPLGWTVSVVRRGAGTDGRNLLYHSLEWHGPYPTDLFAWSFHERYFPDERLLPVYGYPYEVRVRLVDCRTAGSGATAVFTAGTVEVAWRQAPVRRAAGASPADDATGTRMTIILFPISRSNAVRARGALPRGRSGAGARSGSTEERMG
ncbi:MAG TPA: hypothetical protein VF737_07020 [Gemmatimonadaceae bacterium]